MARIHSLILVAAAASLWAPSALAQERFGHAGGFAIAAERITGFAVTHTEYEIDEAPFPSIDFEGDNTSFSLLATDPESPFVAPRVGFDFFVIDGLSLGGFIGYVSNDSDSTVTVGNTDTDDEQKSSTFAFGPRIGYAFMFSDIAGIWPRGGITYVSSRSEDEDDIEIKSSIIAFSAEAMFVIAPVEHAAFLFGPTMDYTLSGSGEYDDPDGVEADIDDIRINTFGVQAGIAAWF